MDPFVELNNKLIKKNQLKAKIIRFPLVTD